MRGSTYATLDLTETGITVLALKASIASLEPIVREMTADKRPEWEETLSQMRALSDRLDCRWRAAISSKHFEKVKADAR